MKQHLFYYSIYFILLYMKPDLQQNKCRNKIKQNIYFILLHMKPKR